MATKSGPAGQCPGGPVLVSFSAKIGPTDFKGTDFGVTGLCQLCR